MAEERYFEMIKNGKRHVFTGNTPRQAALKAATRFGTKGRAGEKIELRERGRKNQDGTYSLHQYRVGYDKKSAPADAPDWLGDTVKEPIVEKIGVRRVDTIPKP
ncbi:MAG: non-histone chromosomal MC1 family protein [Candidatus Aenigmatarchaeota archaeon]